MKNTKQIVVSSRSFGKKQPQGAEMLLEAGYQLEYISDNENVHEQLTAFLKDPNTVAVVSGAEPITREMLEAADSLKIISMHGVGLNHIDVKAAEEKGIIVKAVPGGNAEAVADLTWGLIFSVMRHIPAADRDIRQGGWNKFYGRSVNGKTLGIVGFGHIGRAVAKRAAGFEMQILAYDVFQDETAAAKLNTQYCSLNELYETADIITLHVPLVKETEKMVDIHSFRTMKSSSVLINVSRGDVVHEVSLINALEAGLISGAGLDVFSEEPLPEKHPLFSTPNVVMTPHIGARTEETVRFIGIQCAENILKSLASDQ
jgi:D-3-phosphoglycerate dehydrogenase